MGSTLSNDLVLSSSNSVMLILAFERPQYGAFLWPFESRKNPARRRVGTSRICWVAGHGFWVPKLGVVESRILGVMVVLGAEVKGF